MHTAAAAAAGVLTVGDGVSDWEKTDGNCRAAARRGCSAPQLKKNQHEGTQQALH